MVHRGVGFAALIVGVVGLLCVASLAAAQSPEAQPAKLPILTQDQYAIYLACLEDSTLANAKDSNPLATIGVLNTQWVNTVKQTSLKGLSMTQLAQVTDQAVRALALQQFGKANQTGKVFKEFATESRTGCLSVAQSLQE